MEPTFTIQEAVQFMLEQWDDPRANTQALTVEQIETMFHNARFTVSDLNNGIVAWANSRGSK
jgi:hypothetical protein